MAPSLFVTRRHHNQHSLVRKIGMGILGFLIGGAIETPSGFLLYMLLKKILSAIRGREKDSGPSIYSPLIKVDYLAFLEKENALQSLEIIGRGECGIVYGAELPGNGWKIIVTRKIIQPSEEEAEKDSRALHKKMRQIREAIRIVGQIQHKNLLPLLAHMSRPEYHYLVYEFMKNGRLQDLLEKVSRGMRELDWLSRPRIAKGWGGGLEYLHVNPHKRVIHRDQKPAYALLDDDMKARIADFGLAKEMREEEDTRDGDKRGGDAGVHSKDVRCMISQINH